MQLICKFYSTISARTIITITITITRLHNHHHHFIIASQKMEHFVWQKHLSFASTLTHTHTHKHTPKENKKSIIICIFRAILTIYIILYSSIFIININSKQNERGCVCVWWYSWCIIINVAKWFFFLFALFDIFYGAMTITIVVIIILIWVDR